jgi:hypothetical protein
MMTHDGGCSRYDTEKYLGTLLDFGSEGRAFQLMKTPTPDEGSIKPASLAILIDSICLSRRSCGL